MMVTDTGVSIKCHGLRDAVVRTGYPMTVRDAGVRTGCLVAMRGML